ncbi:MAG: tRNA uridine-5-carboxymethylaminomethyl(34) synthesis GTPase MnmE [Muribaculaceae bacterium]|nr:tRNA uridine-5-carboxymethylaminomethyl(34) synthesis GTPase MnmE [Muribaculaceae bacterium]
MKSDTINLEDTICAVSTPPGVGGIAVIRVSGPQAIAVTDRIWRGKPLEETPGHTVRFGRVIDPTRGDEMLDEAVATVFRNPASFTGEDVVELSVHGSKYVQRRLLEILTGQGARLAEPGEFTRRAFANGKMDLAQAEAVADVIASNSRAAHRLAASQMRGGFSRRLEELRDKLLDLASLLELELDFSEEEVEFASRERLREIATEIHDEVSRLEKSFSAGSAIKDGIPVAIVGPTNAGKSSLLNLLLGEDRAIVSDIHGTTRDTIEDTLEIGDYLFRFIDTAGLRETDDPIEALGIERSRQALSRAAIIISVVDASRPLPCPIDELPDAPQEIPTILLLNKSDLASGNPDGFPHSIDVDSFDYASVIHFSTKTGEGHKELLTALTEIADRLRGTTDEDTIMVTNLRHAQALREASASTSAILLGLRTNLPGDLIAQDLRATLHHLSSITGTLTTPDILASIFSRFCIGK